MAEFSSYSEIKSLFAEEYQKTDAFIKEVLFPIENYNEQFFENLSFCLSGPSKQLRSCLIFLFTRATGGKIDNNTIKLAAAVEIIHNATLIHDDIIDDADIRRGQKTLHKNYNSKLAIIAGDYLLSCAIKILSDIQNHDIIESFADALKQLCKGEIRQYFAEKRTPSIFEYVEKSNAKTASLFTAALKSAALLNKSLFIKELEIFAKNFGIAFQIKDDLNNFIDEKFKKPLLLDMNSGIYTAPVIFAFGEKKDLSAILTETIYKKSVEEENILQTKKLIISKMNIAKNALIPLPESVYKNAITAICDFLCK